MKMLKKIGRWIALWFAPPCLVLLAGGCMSPPAPPEEATAITQAEVEELRNDIARMKANKDRVDATWAKLWTDENAKRIKADFEDRAEALALTAAAESRPVTGDEISALLAQHLSVSQAAAAAIEATRVAAVDPNFDVAAERAELVLEYVSEISERQRALNRARKSIGLRAQPPPAVPPAAKGTP